jgi:hypothetical protein
MAKKKSKKNASGEADGTTVALVAHPRARRSIRRLRARAGLIALVAVTYLSLRAGVPAFDAVLRGLAGGIVAHFVAWGAGVVAWRHFVLAELAAHHEAQQERLRKHREAAAEAASAS